MKMIHIWPLVLAVISPGNAHGASLILADEGGWNGIFLEASVRSGFRESGGSGEVFTSDSGFLSIAPGVHPAGTTLTMVSSMSGLTPLAVSLLPDSGETKDIAQGTLTASFTIGTASTADSFDFAFNSTTSAVTAHVDFGAGPVPADAFFEAEVRLRSFAPVTMPGAVLRLPDLPALTSPATEFMVATVSTYVGGSQLAGFMTADSPGFEIPIELIETPQNLDYNFTYSIVTPFGTDPTIGYSFSGSTAVPEPAASYAMLLGLLTACRRRRKFRT